MERLTPVVLAIGTTHPFNIAGLGLDARIASLLDVRIVTIVAGISAQSARAVLRRTPVDRATIEAQFAAVRDLPIAAVHVGALLDERSVRTVASGLRVFAGIPVICDPVIAATGGDRLADDATVAALHDTLFACCTLITPNLAEAGLLLARALADADAMEAAAAALVAAGVAAVLIKGGHLAGDAIDVFADATTVKRWTSPRLPGSLRGTGDLLACAIAARLAHGDSLLAAIEAARAFVRRCFAAAVPFAGTRTVP